MKSPEVFAMVMAGGKGERGRGVHVDAGAQIEGFGSQARLCRVSADRSTVIPPRSRVGIDAVNDLQRFHVSQSGLVVLSRTSVRPDRMRHAS